jgi:hypothetical protein
MADQADKKEAQQKAAREELQSITEKRRLNREKEKRALAEQTLRRTESLKQQVTLTPNPHPSHAYITLKRMNEQGMSV